jgi:hypothetical protein
MSDKIVLKDSVKKINDYELYQKINELKKELCEMTEYHSTVPFMEVDGIKYIRDTLFDEEGNQYEGLIVLDTIDLSFVLNDMIDLMFLKPNMKHIISSPKKSKLKRTLILKNCVIDAHEREILFGKSPMFHEYNIGSFTMFNDQDENEQITNILTNLYEFLVQLKKDILELN